MLVADLQKYTVSAALELNGSRWLFNRLQSMEMEITCMEARVEAWRLLTVGLRPEQEPFILYCSRELDCRDLRHQNVG